MVEVQQAVKAASDYLRSLYEAENVRDIRLEEVVYDDRVDDFVVPQAVIRSPRARWLVTLSFERFPDREYKQFEILADTGEVRAMRIVKV